MLNFLLKQLFNYPLSERDKRNETRGDLCIDLDKLTDLKSLVVFVVTSLEVYKDTVKLLLKCDRNR